MVAAVAGCPLLAQIQRLKATLAEIEPLFHQPPQQTLVAATPLPALPTVPVPVPPPLHWLLLIALEIAVFFCYFETKLTFCP